MRVVTESVNVRRIREDQAYFTGPEKVVLDLIIARELWETSASQQGAEDMASVTFNFMYQLDWAK
jgi:hypothetical protein